MKKKPFLVWLIPLILLLLLIPFIVPSSLPWAGAEEALPEYEPVELSNSSPGTVPAEEVEWNKKTTRDRTLIQCTVFFVLTIIYRYLLCVLKYKVVI